MGNNIKDKIKRLSAPFAERDIEWVVTFTANQTSYEDVIMGVAPYIKRESIMDRLDTIFGPTGWTNEMMPSDVGLYQAIILFGEDNYSIKKWDGAAIHVGANDDIDMVKSVSTQSFRRVAELFGVGRYLKSLPVLFARKQAKDDYSAENNTYVSKLKMKVRWNPPALPPEYLPDYMTPEQWRLLSQLQRHFEGEERANIQAILDTWEGDYTSFSYPEAVSNIDRILAQISSSRSYVKANQVHGSRNQRKSSGPPPPPPPSNDPKPQGAKPKSPPPNSGGVSDRYKKNFKALQNMIKQNKKDDPAFLLADQQTIEALEKEIDTSIKKKKPIPPKELIAHIEAIQEWKNEIDEKDDLPF